MFADTFLTGGKNMANKKTYEIKLTQTQRKHLEEITKKGKNGARVIKRAQILLEASEGKTDKKIVHILKVSMATVWRIRKEFFKEGLESAIYDKKRPGKPCKMNDKQEAMLIATACSKPPEGRIHWTLRLLANKMVELEVIEDISHETVRKTLKKTSNKTLAKKAMVHSQN